MELKTIEGPWDEIVRRAGEFEGHLVRITILDGPAPLTLDRALGDLLEEADRLSASLPPGPAEDPAGHWSEAVVDKFRRQGFEP